jgi:hypothetical protein
VEFAAPQIALHNVAQPASQNGDSVSQVSLTGRVLSGENIDYALMLLVIAGLVVVQLRRTQDIVQRSILRA